MGAWSVSITGKDISCILGNWNILVLSLMLSLVLLLSGCTPWPPKIPHDYIRQVEEEVKEDFPYISRIQLSGGTPVAASWNFHLSQAKDVDELDELILWMKEFALRDETFQALHDTGGYDPRLSHVAIVITKNMSNEIIYRAYTSTNSLTDDFPPWRVQIP